MNPTHGGYGGTELRSQPSAEAPPAEPGEPVEEEEGAETGQSAAAKSPLLRALMHVKWATLLQKAGKYERAWDFSAD